MQPLVVRLIGLVGGVATSQNTIIELQNKGGVTEMTIGDRIQELRKKKGISQEDLANSIDVSRQAVSKWESGQSSPELEKIILLSEYFEVTTDYLIKGVEMSLLVQENGPDAVIFAVVSSATNVVGLIAALVIWTQWQVPLAVGVGLAIMVVGTIQFIIGQTIPSRNKAKARKWFIAINIWVLSWIPVSCVFNLLDGILGGFVPRIAPIPLLGNSLVSFGLCWIFYFFLCATTDFIVLKRNNLLGFLHK